MNKHFLFIGALFVLLLSGCEKKEDPQPLPQRCSASDYVQVTIGTQVWMAENYRCYKYDTESEAYKAGVKSVSISSAQVYTPYFTEGSRIKLPDYMNESHKAKLGYHYNWAAAVGVADGLKQTENFTEPRQGICPNGWHIPTLAEWNTLIDFIGVSEGKGVDYAGKHLKTTSGWKDNGNGVDSYGFAVLPSGFSYGTNILEIGFNANFWTATVGGSSKEKAFKRNFTFDSDLCGVDTYDKNIGQSVRCVKN